MFAAGFCGVGLLCGFAVGFARWFLGESLSVKWFDFLVEWALVDGFCCVYFIRDL